MNKKSLIWLAILMLTVIMGCQQGGDEEAVIIPVAVNAVERGDVFQSLFYNGDVKAEQEVMVFSKVPDRIERFFVDAGDAVKQGAPIAKITATVYDQGLRQATAGLSAAKAAALNMTSEYERAQRLRKEDAMSQQQFEGVKTQYEAAAAQLKQAEAMMLMAKSQAEDASITAPISGIIGKRYLEAGDMAAPSMPVVSVVQMNRVKIEAEATEADLGRLKVGQDVEVHVRSYPSEIFKGKVSKISPVLDPLTRMASFEVMVDNQDHRLKPGMFAEIEVTTGLISSTLKIPRHVVIENSDLVMVNGKEELQKKYFVYVVNDSMKAEQRQLDVEYVNHTVLAVSGGIQEGDKLVVQGQMNLRNGASVMIPQSEEK